MPREIPVGFVGDWEQKGDCMSRRSDGEKIVLRHQRTLTGSVPRNRAFEMSTSFSGGSVESSRDTTKADESISRRITALWGTEDISAKS